MNTNMKLARCIKKTTMFTVVCGCLLYALTYSPLVLVHKSPWIPVSLGFYQQNRSIVVTTFPPTRGPPQMSNPPVIIFTSFSNRTDKLFVYTNTIRNWASFLPHIQPVLFTTFDSGPVIDIAKKYGWHIHANPTVNKFGCPVLKDMYLAAYKLFNATFYGYANGDILFDLGLNETLNKMDEHLDSIGISMLFGIRSNYKLLPEANYTDMPLWPPERIHQLGMGNQTKLFKADAFDYFFVTKKYPFGYIKPLVIGRSGFDTYLTAMTNTMKLNNVDGTKSITALHQTRLGWKLRPQCQQRRGR